MPTAAELIPRRGTKSSVSVTPESALRNSAVWASVRLRANLMSSFPVDLYRKVDGLQVEIPTKPPVLVAPAPKVTIREFLYSTQTDLDRFGNCFGVITARDGLGFPARIDLVPAESVTVVVRDGELTGYRIGTAVFDPVDVWHEKQYTVPGLHVGLSPVAYAAWALGEYASIQAFASDWFANGTMPASVLKNAERVIPPDTAKEIKEQYRATVASGDVFVIGKDWEFDMLSVQFAASQWLEAKQHGVADIARFFDVPGDLIDSAVSGSSITYANLTQRNLQFLIMHLGPAVGRREDALSDLTPRPRFVKLNTDSLLRMDPMQRSAMLAAEVAGRLRAPSEARALHNLPPYTESQLAEFDRLWGRPNTAPSALPAPVKGAAP